MIGQLVIQTVRAGCGKLTNRLMSASSDEWTRRGRWHQCQCAERSAQVLEHAGRFEPPFEVVGASAPSIRRWPASQRWFGNVGWQLVPKVEMPLQQIVTRELTLVGVCASSGEYPACIDLMARGSIDVSAFISAFAPLEEGPMWFDRLYRQEPGLMKVVLKPT
jgi:L-iditol 2-dehydrogenase